MSTCFRARHLHQDRRRQRAFDQRAGAGVGNAVAPAAERRAEGEVARLRSRTGQHQIAQTREAHQGRRPRAVGSGETTKFGEAARNQRRASAGAHPQARGHAPSEGEYGFGRPADLDAAHVGRMVESEVGTAQRLAERARQRLVSAGERQGGRQAGGDIGGEARPGQHGGRPARRRFGHNLGHEFL